MKNIYKISVLALSIVCSSYSSYASDISQQLINNYKLSKRTYLENSDELINSLNNRKTLEINDIDELTPNLLETFPRLTNLTINVKDKSFTAEKASLIPKSITHLYIPYFKLKTTHLKNILSSKEDGFEILVIRNIPEKFTNDTTNNNNIKKVKNLFIYNDIYK